MSVIKLAYEQQKLVSLKGAHFKPIKTPFGLAIAPHGGGSVVLESSIAPSVLQTMCICDALPVLYERMYVTVGEGNFQIVAPALVEPIKQSNGFLFPKFELEVARQIAEHLNQFADGSAVETPKGFELIDHFSEEPRVFVENEIVTFKRKPVTVNALLGTWHWTNIHKNLVSKRAHEAGFHLVIR